MILLAEDHPANQLVIKLQLTDLGYSCHIVSNGKEALQAAINEQYQLILMDCYMPELDGFVSTGAIREHERGIHRHTPIIAMTASATVEDRDHCIDAGMDDFISKPINLDDLRQILEKWISSPESDQEMEKQRSAETMVDFDFSRYLVLGREKSYKIIGTFIPSTISCLDAIGKALLSTEVETLSQQAHKLKGSCGTIGANEMYSLAKELEQAAQKTDWVAARRLHSRLTTSLQRLIQQTERFLNASFS